MWQLITSTVRSVNPFAGVAVNPIAADTAEFERLQQDAYQLDMAIAEYDQNVTKDNGHLPIVGQTDKDADISQPAIRDDECFKGKGIVTVLDSEHGIVDDRLFFDPNHQVSAGVVITDLRVGCTVCYLAHRMSDDIPVRIVRIVEVENNVWEQPSEERTREMVEELRHQQPQVFSTSHRSMHGEVIGRRKQFVSILLDNGETEDIDLEAVRTSFVPRTGDLVVLDCVVQADPSFGDMTGQVVEVIGLTPTRAKCEEGIVTSVDADGGGVVGRMYYFRADSVDRQYLLPQKGDRVTVEAIECSMRSQYAWRCVKVVLMESKLRLAEGVNQRSGGNPMVNQSEAKDAQEKIDLKRNKEGLVISEDLHFRLKSIGERQQLSMYIHNQSDKPHKLTSVQFRAGKNRESQPQLSLLRPSINHIFTIQPDQTVEYVFEATGRNFGQCTEDIIFNFGSRVRIMRLLHLYLDDTTGATPSIGTGLNVYRNRAYTQNVWNRQYDVVAGVRLNERANFVAVKFGSWEVPQPLRNAVLGQLTNIEIDERLARLLPFLTDTLTFRTYEQSMHSLLYLEEIQQFHAMRRYDRDRAHFRRENEYLALAVPNMAETRPSLVLGDYLLATSPWKKPEHPLLHSRTDDIRLTAHRGEIHKILSDRILLKFNENFHAAYGGDDWKLEFHFSRIPMRKCHYAVQRIIQKMGEQFLFPQRLVKCAAVQLDVRLDEDGRMWLCRGNGTADTELPWFEQSLNIVQKEAVKNVLRGEARPMPYVIFGPPGTGKTSTLIETILQLFVNVRDSRLLVAAPSNSAANLIAQRLVASGRLQAGDFVRVAGFNAIEAGRIPDELLPYTATCQIAREGTVKMDVRVLDSGVKMRCNVSSLGRHRITIGTCNTLGTLMQMEFARDHFTHTLLDEAGQCLEPEALIPMTFVNKDSGQVVLAGDPMQLGPVVMSKQAMDRGLQQSLLVRLLDRFPYQMDHERFQSGYDARLVTKLLFCYRSLPSIMTLFSHLFYHDQLRPTICPETSAESALLRKLGGILPNNGLRTANYGAFFIGIRGDDLQDADSPSWFNAAEARSVFNFLVELYMAGVGPDDIGIITPYTKQVKVIRNMIAEHEIKVPKVGTVEEFQGQERMVVLMSTVRSSNEMLHQDRFFKLGFVSNPKRLNVSISRARALLVVFGNPHLLANDVSWRYLLRQCIQNNTYRGCDLPRRMLERSERARSAEQAAATEAVAASNSAVA